MGSDYLYLGCASSVHITANINIALFSKQRLPAGYQKKLFRNYLRVGVAKRIIVNDAEH